MAVKGIRIHAEGHAVGRLGWLRAAVLGADDGIVSTACLVLGVAAAGGGRSAVITAGVAGLAAGAMSMAAGEYVSVSSQRDAERADLARERRELQDDPAGELDELTSIYVDRGLDRELARRVAEQLTAVNPLRAHAREELGLSEAMAARPFQAAAASAAAFTTGALLPLVSIAASPGTLRIGLTIATTLIALAATGWLGARLGSAPTVRAAVRVTIWGGAAMAITSAIGALTGSIV